MSSSQYCIIQTLDGCNLGRNVLFLVFIIICNPFFHLSASVAIGAAVIADGNGDELILRICDGYDDNGSETIETIVLFSSSLSSTSCSCFSFTGSNMIAS